MFQKKIMWSNGGNKGSETLINSNGVPVDINGYQRFWDATDERWVLEADLVFGHDNCEAVWMKDLGGWDLTHENRLPYQQRRSYKVDQARIEKRNAANPPKQDFPEGVVVTDGIPRWKNGKEYWGHYDADGTLWGACWWC